MPRIVIADDEASARRRLERMLVGEPGLSVVGEFCDGASAIEGIRRLQPDIALLDIHMPECDGLDVAKAVHGPGGPAIVFVTAFDCYALRAFEVHAVDYLVKPVEAERLHRTLAHLRARNAQPGTAEFERLARLIEDMRNSECATTAQTHRAQRDRLLVAVDGRSIVINVADIEWIEAASNYVRLHRAADALLLRESLNSLQATLDPATFLRVHRGALVNIAKITELQPWFSGAAVLILSSGARLTVSRSHRKQLEAHFGAGAPA